MYIYIKPQKLCSTYSNFYVKNTHFIIPFIIEPLVFSLRHWYFGIYGRANLCRSERARTHFAAAISRESGTKGGICNGHVDKGPAFETAVTVINIGDNKRSLNQIAMARCAGRLRARTFRRRRRRRGRRGQLLCYSLRRENAVNFDS